MVNQPLAERLRPNTLDNYVGQQHLVGQNGVIRKMIESGRLSSFILWGPPGVGKTTLASIIAAKLDRPFQVLSAINSGVKDVREAIEKAKSKQFFSRPNPILFIDEIHRFSKSQQDSLLGAVEKGIITLIGATTENPSFEVISALLSRCQVYVLKPLTKEEMDKIIVSAVEKDTEYKKLNIDFQEKEAIFLHAGGDARKLLNILEILINSFGPDDDIVITNEVVTNTLQKNIAIYDKSGEQHYDIVSAFIKSIRGSDPDASLYWLARMIEGGEDVKFIARRLIISASEDIGMANPNALLLANQCFQAINVIGMPEARIILSQTTVYLATSPKSNASYLAIKKAQSVVRETGNLPVPLHLRNAPTALMKNLGYGLKYKYSHDFAGNFVEQNFFPEELTDKSFYLPQQNPTEQKIFERLKKWWKDRFK